MLAGQPFTELVVVRHGETEWNREGRYMGHLDSQLTELGLTQARALAERLRGMEFAALYSSDLGRAMRTAEIIGATCGLPVVSMPGIKERRMGFFQGLTLDEVIEGHADIRDRMIADPDFAPPGGETALEFHQRVSCEFQAIAEHHSGERVLAVCHGGTLETLLRYALNIPLNAPRPVRAHNCSYNVFQVFPDYWMVCTWGDVGHLRGVR